MGKSVTYLTGTNLWQKLHLMMGMGETARTEIADRELASTRERPASRDESHKHNTQRQLGGITRKYADKNKKGRKM